MRSELDHLQTVAGHSMDVWLHYLMSFTGELPSADASMV